MSLVDVIVGVRNEEKHLKRCITSLQAQTIADIQIFVVDGQSKDRTRDIVQEKMKEDSRIKLFDNPKKVISSARNIGIKASQAQYIAYLDGHCYVDPDWLETLISSYQKYERKCKVGGVGSTYSSPDDDTDYGKVVAQVLRTSLGGLGTAYRKDEKIQMVDTVAFALYKLSIIRNEGILYDELMTQCEDTDFNYKLLKKGYVLLKHPDALVYQYRRPNTLQFLRQMIDYGEGRAKLVLKYKETLKLYHLIPVLLVFYLFISIISLILGMISFIRTKELFFIFFPILIYLIIILAYTLTISLKNRSLKYLYAFLIFPAIHIGYGFGVLKGFIMSICK
ncbi:MAG: glycosyltransferase [Methanobacteriaceae archaeon]|nr:glycosyltransferase [Methanobacteriaceae archaeon]